jgi:hypothetical protein
MGMKIFLVVSLLLVSVVEAVFNSSSGELAYYPYGISHKYFCANHGQWNGSCDIDLSAPSEMTMNNPEIYSEADWSERCDPWKGVTETLTLTFDEATGVWKNSTGNVKTGWKGGNNWTCPEDQRSMSGCGDFRTDTRGTMCESRVSLFGCGRPEQADRRIVNVGEVPTMLIPQRHVCVQHPIFYDNINQGTVIAPALGRHRERWAMWGEYDYLPPQRWMHNAEHGGVIFLYNPCLDEESLCALRRYIQKWQAKIGQIAWEGHDADKFRFLLTPFKNLNTPISIVMWGHVYGSKCFNEHDMDYFIQKWYRNGIEDWPPGGAYNYLWKSYDLDYIRLDTANCAELPTAGEMHASYMLPALASAENTASVASVATSIVRSGNMVLVVLSVVMALVF